MTRTDEFFVGYLPVPVVLKRRLKIVTAIAASLIVGIALILGLGRYHFSPSTFEFGEYRAFEGVILERPYPLLLVSRPGKTSDSQSFSTYLLVDQFKHGADARVRGLHARRVRLEAALIHRDGETMLEIKPGSIKEDSGSGEVETVKMMGLGTVTIKGELVDTKCYLGVMNPGSGKVHRDCAARCISGGVPLALVTTGQRDRQVYFLRTTEKDQILRSLLQHAGEVVSISGEVFEIGQEKFMIPSSGPRS